MDGWGGINEIGGAESPPLDPNAPSDVDLVDKLYVDVFNTPAGLQLLRHWKRQYLDQPVCVPGVGADMGFFREGQNSVVHDSIRRLTRGLTPKT